MARRLILGVMMTLLGVSALALAQQTEMTMAEYEARLADCRARQRAADSTGQQVDQRVTEMREEISTIEGQVVEIEHEVLELTSSDSTELGEYISQLDAIVQQLRAMRQLPANQIVDAREAGELDAIQARLDELKGNLLAALPESQQRINAAQRLLDELGSVQRPIPPVRRDQYIVERGDCLWRVAGQANQYGNPYEWVKIYSASRDIVGDDPNLIFPDQALVIPRNEAPGTHWVQQGENLSAIADRRYGDPTLWAELYRANQDLIERVGGDEYTIYPHLVLNVPQQ